MTRALFFHQRPPGRASIPCAFFHLLRVGSLLVCAVSTSSSNGSMERSIVRQRIVGCWTERDITSRLRIGALGATNKSAGSAITGSLLCGSGAKSGRLDKALALL